ncbi:MAG: cytochrome P460 family protein [Candidatus Rokuibacteriota bacterium]
MSRGVTAVIAVLALLAGLYIAAPTSAGPDKIAFPANWKSHVLYTTVDRSDNKQHRELYASSKEAVEAMKAGKPLPHGTVLTLVQYKAQLDAQGQPVKGPDGRFVKGDLAAFTVMEKRQGWGAEYPPELRNGEWEYAVFSADGKLNEKANYKGCFQCHKPHERQDFVISLAALKGGTGSMAKGAADVKIAAFAFGPNKVTAATGKPVTWVNDDASPHQITVTTGSPQRGPVMTRGQSYAHTFAAAGVYDYICGLHPSMKGQVEVK